MFVRNQGGLGNLGQDDLSAYTDESTVTGLPAYAEIGLAVLAVFALSKVWGATKQVTRTVRRARSQRSAKAARRGQLKAELAGL